MGQILGLLLVVAVLAIVFAVMASAVLRRRGFQVRRGLCRGAVDLRTILTALSVVGAIAAKLVAGPDLSLGTVLISIVGALGFWGHGEVVAKATREHTAAVKEQIAMMARRN